MKVAHLATSLHGGAGIAAYRIHESLILSGVDSTIFALSAPAEYQNKPGVTVIKRNFTKKNFSSAVTAFQSFAVQKTENLFTPFSIHQSSLKEMIDSNFDILHLHNTYNLSNWRELNSLIGKASVVMTLHDMRNFTGGCHYSNDCEKYIDHNCSNCPQSKLGFKQIVQNSFQRSIKITNEFARVSLVAPSQWILDKARDSLMWKKREMSLIRNPIPELETYEKSVQNRARNKIGFISPELTNPFKGFDVFIAALRKMPQDWWQSNEIIIVGKGMVPDFGPPSKITRIEKISPQEMVDIYDELDYLVIPSRQDNFPNVIGEATLRGVNLILSSAGGLNEAAQIFDFPKFQSGDSENLAKCLLNLQMIERGLVVEKAKEMFSYVSAATAYKNLYMTSK